MKITNLLCATPFATMLVSPSPVLAKELLEDLWIGSNKHDADSNGVKIHYVAVGKGQLILMIHGFPDFCIPSRRQMEALSGHYRVVAMDQPRLRPVGPSTRRQRYATVLAGQTMSARSSRRRAATAP